MIGLFLSDCFKIASLLDAISLPIWLRFGSQDLETSRLGDVLGRLEGVSAAARGGSDASWRHQGRLVCVLERLGCVLMRPGSVLGPKTHPRRTWLSNGNGKRVEHTSTL